MLKKIISGENGHLSGDCEYVIVVLVGLNYLAHFAVADTAVGGFFAVDNSDCAPFCKPRGFASQAQKLVSIERNFSFQLSVSHKFFDLVAVY